MVFFSAILHSSKGFPKKSRFVDSLRLLVRGGSGGHGLPKYGGVGGPGGDIYVKGKEDATLKSVAKANPSKRVVASHGENSLKNRILGLKGNDVTIEVPLGITVYNEMGQALGEINQEGDRVLVAKGGTGGSEKTGFCGLRGEKLMVTLDLKLIADVGLVGFPNAGKSTLLSVLSNAKPKIASYPFTTIQPNLGVLMYPDLRQITMADLPGLIEGAHANIGMGHRFLKHVERTSILLLVVDVSGFQLGPKYKKRGALETLILLNKELELYKSELLDKPALLVVNKMDLPGAEDVFKDIDCAAQDLKSSFDDVPEFMRPTRALSFARILKMSARSGDPQEVLELKNEIRKLIDETLVPDSDGDLELFRKIDKEYKKTGPIMI
uniref:GTP-binding protein 10 n=1 Tax=Lygus hesperus TaxID=30085 RepID=A0A0A9Z9B9_LYGHE